MTFTKERIFVSDQPQELGQKRPEDLYTSLGDHIIKSLTDDHPDKVILVDAATGREWTGIELRDSILNVASALIDLYDFKRGTVACISYDHCDTTVILALAIVCAGGALACAYHRDPYRELLYLAQKVRPEFLFCHGKNLHWASQLESDLDGLRVKAISMDKDGDNEDTIDRLLNYSHRDAKCSSQVPVVCANMYEDLAFITMSSGTTGQPKAVPMTHANCLWDQSLMRGVHTAKVACSASLDYVSGRLIVMGAVKCGYAAIIINGFEPANFLSAIERFRVSVVFLGAAAFYSLITHPKLEDYDMSSVQVAFPMGAKIIYLEEMGEFLKKHPHIRFLRQGYGASEFSGCAMNNKLTPENYLANCDNCGQLSPGFRVKVVDSATGELLGVGQSGMLHVWGPTLFPGYYDRSAAVLGTGGPQLKRDGGVFDADGYYVTGDIGYFNQREELFIVGRQKELMNCRGSKKVLPQEIEELLVEHPFVAKACVIGVPNKVELTLHCPRGFIVPKADGYLAATEETGQVNGRQVEGEVLEHRGEHKLCRSLPEAKRKSLAEDVMSFLNERIGYEKQLTGGLVVLDEIPTLRSTGKMNKTYLRSLTYDQVSIYGDRSEPTTKPDDK